MEYIILLISLAGIVFSADFLVAGSVSIARKFKVSDFVIGAAIIGVGTSAPELMVSFMGAIGGNADVAIGNVVGSNIFNVLGILGITAIFFPVTFDRQNLKFEIPFCIGVSALLMLLAFNFFNGADQCIARTDGLLLLMTFAVFMWLSFSRDKKMKAAVPASEEQKEEKIDPMWLALINAVPFAQWNILVVMISGGLICWILSNFISNSAAANLIVPILAVVGTALLDDPTSSTSFLALGGEPCDKARRFLKTSGYDI